MRRTVSLLLCAALLLGLLGACRGEAPAGPACAPETEWTAEDLAQLAVRQSGCEDPDGLERLSAARDGERLAAYLENAYGLEGWVDAAVSRAAGASAVEIAVVRLEDDGAAVRAATALMSYISSRQGDFAGYAPAEADMVANGELLQSGPWAALFICPDAVGASDAVSAALHGGECPASAVDGVQPEGGYPAEDPDYPGRVRFVQPDKDDMSLYDTSAIRAAWAAEDPSGLSREDREIYNAARRALDRALKDGMSDYEKEAAIYAWVVNNVDYDWTHQDRTKQTPRASFTPYGGLVKRTAVCLGYAATFQLLCDLAGVECITVPGAAFGSQEDHGWNMVRLNGAWYCVDVTWDANARERAGRGSPEDWEFFNVTSDEMAASDHQWDYANTPEATAMDRGRG